MLLRNKEIYLKFIFYFLIKQKFESVNLLMKQVNPIEIYPVGSRGVIFSFYDDIMGDTTLCYMIKAEKYNFLIDTYLGPKRMEPIKNYMNKQNIAEKPLIIIYSHAHWDHYRGTSAFKPLLIISHNICNEIMHQNAKNELEKKESPGESDIIIKYPTITFETNLIFAESKIKLRYAPGHTNDSILISDEIDDILIAGDNIEYPIPYLQNIDLNTYCSTLQSILDLNPKFIIPGHGSIQENTDLVKSNLKYLQDYLKDSLNFEKMPIDVLKQHIYNLKLLSDIYKKSNRKEGDKVFKKSLSLLKLLPDTEKEEIFKVLNKK